MSVPKSQTVLALGRTEVVIKFIMKQHLVSAQWKNNTATGKTKGCRKQVGREGLSGLALHLSLLTFYCGRWRNIFGEKQGAFISREKLRMSGVYIWHTPSLYVFSHFHSNRGSKTLYLLSPFWVKTDTHWEVYPPEIPESAFSFCK